MKRVEHIMTQAGDAEAGDLFKQQESQSWQLVWKWRSQTFTQMSQVLCAG